MISNMNFYNFIHKQILILIGLSISTGLGYLYIAYYYSTMYEEIIWYMLNIATSAWGYKLHLYYKNNVLSFKEKSSWLKELNYFLYIYFLLWSSIFVIYATKDNIYMHYIAIATQFGTAVVSATVLVSQRKLSIAVLSTLILPLFIYFILINDFYSYLLALFTLVVSGVLLYSSNNTYNYLVESQFQAYHDYLTKLGNRRYFIELIEDSIQVQKISGKYVYLLLIDLDHFKIINNTLGHDIGDSLLIEVSQRMNKISKQFNSTISRIGGDEFCILGSQYDDSKVCEKDALLLANSLLKYIKEPYIIEEHYLYISASVGIKVIDNSSIDVNVFIKEADIAMYEAKHKGRDTIIVFSNELSKDIQYKLEIERLMQFAILDNEISLHYQAKMNLKTNEIACEVLARWNSKTHGKINPELFITISEKSGMIIALGTYILEESFKTIKQWHEDKIKVYSISINISMKQILHKNFISTVNQLSKKYLCKESLAKVTFEITETSASGDMELLINNISLIKEMGIKLSMDDFGTGYSSLSNLSKLKLDEVKIDQSFIKSLDNDSSYEKTMIQTILNISENLNMSVVAEGVENKKQVDFLLENNCYIMQGNYYAKPKSKRDFETFVFEHHNKENTL